MIYIFWPYKNVPSWLQRVTFSGESNGNIPKFFHYGFGFVVKKYDTCHVYTICGCFAKLFGAGMSVDIRGGVGGIYFYKSIMDMLSAII